MKVKSKLVTVAEVRRKIGTKYGKRTLSGIAGWREFQRRPGVLDSELYVVAQCECGQEDEVRWRALSTGKANSCKRCSLVDNRHGR